MDRPTQFKIGIGVVFTLIVLIIPTAATLRADTAAKPMMSHDFTDVPVTGQEFMEPYINEFYHLGITGGCSVSPMQYCPTNPVTRGSMAVFMGRALGYVDMVDDGWNARAYFKQTGTENDDHGVLAWSPNGYAVMGSSEGGFGVYGVSDSASGVLGESSSSFGVFGGSITSTGVFGRSSSGFGVSAISDAANALIAHSTTESLGDSIYDAILGGTNGELFGFSLNFFSNSGMVVDLDNDNNSAEAFSVRSGDNTTVLSVSETSGATVSATIDSSADSIYDVTLGGTWGEMFGQTLYLFSNNGFVITLDKDNNGNDSFLLRDTSGADQFIIEEDGDTTINGNLQINGNYTATGTKSAIVDTVSYGTRAMYAVEATEVLFEEVGSAELIDGEAVITIDPMFAETVNLDEPYQVFLTPVGGSGLLYVAEKTATHIVIRSDDASNLHFDYRIVAKRLGYEDVRMEEIGD